MLQKYSAVNGRVIPNDHGAISHVHGRRRNIYGSSHNLHHRGAGIVPELCAVCFIARYYMRLAPDPEEREAVAQIVPAPVHLDVPRAPGLPPGVDAVIGEHDKTFIAFGDGQSEAIAARPGERYRDVDEERKLDVALRAFAGDDFHDRGQYRHGLKDRIE
jgi:hypothetical protein